MRSLLVLPFALFTLLVGFTQAPANPTPDPLPLYAPQSLQVEQSTADAEEFTYTARLPRGHTHTCGRGHTWDHDANPSHTCTVPVRQTDGTYRPCGISQTTIDQPWRNVTVAVRRVRPRTTAVAAYAFVPDPLPIWNFIPPSPPIPVPAIPPAVVEYQSSPCGAGGCNNQYFQSSRQPLFPRLRLLRD